MNLREVREDKPSVKRLRKSGRLGGETDQLINLFAGELQRFSQNDPTYDFVILGRREGSLVPVEVLGIWWKPFMRICLEVHEFAGVVLRHRFHQFNQTRHSLCRIVSLDHDS